ncbi:MAG TPA: glycosyltransferase family 9 protein [Chlamydiales bacterium]|nr:glycosyltransferase family 9 protein [Chlamydiales bacterium]
MDIQCGLRLHKIIIVKIAAIGDVVMALPLLAHLRTHFPESHITWICGEQVKPLIEATGLVDRLIAVNEKKLLRGNVFSKFYTLFKIWSCLLGQKFDLSLTLHPDPRYRWIPFPIRCKERRFLTRRGRRINPIPGRYHVTEYLRLFTGNDGPEETPPVFPKIHLPKDEYVREVLISLEGKPIVVIAPGGAKNVLADDALRRWPISAYAVLMKGLNDYPIHLLVVGTESDRWVVEHLRGVRYRDLIGKLELLQCLSLLEGSQLLITHDSGPLHLTKLVNCPAIGLFGPTNPFEKVGKGEKIKVLWGGERLACRPCYDGKTYAACKRNLCLENIKPQRVLQEALELLGAPKCNVKRALH